MLKDGYTYLFYRFVITALHWKNNMYYVMEGNVEHFTQFNRL